MKTFDIAKRSARNITQSKGRTLLTALAIAVGAFTIMMSLAAGTGTRQYLKNLVETNIDPQTIIVSKGKGSMKTTGSPDSLQEYTDGTATTSYNEKLLTDADIDKLKSMKNVVSVIPSYSVTPKWVQFEGIDQKYSMTVATYNPALKSNTVAGTLPQKGTDITESEIVIPESFAKTLKKTPAELVGKKITIVAESQGEKLSQEQLMQLYATGGAGAVQAATQPKTQQFVVTVKAVTTSDSGMSMRGSNKSGQISAGLAKTISEFASKDSSSYHQYYSATIKVKDGVDPMTVRDEIKKGDFDAMTVEDLQQTMFQMVNILQYVVTGFGILALIASIFGIINTQYISVLERTSQIGLMKALGMSNRGVGKLFRYEAVWIGFLGGVIGIALAWVAVQLLNPWISKTLNLGAGNTLLGFDWIQALILLAVLIFIAIVAGWFPSRKAAKLDPIEALRTE